MAMKTIVALPRQGIGPEVVDATCELLMGTGLTLNTLTPPGQAPARGDQARGPRGRRRALRRGRPIYESRGRLAPLGDERVGRGAADPLLPGDALAAGRPRGGIDYILLRENSEGIYPGREGGLADLVKVVQDLADRTGRKVKDFGTEGRFAVKVVTLKGAERIARFAVELARKRKAQGKPGKITCVTKSNVMPRTDGLPQETVERIVREPGGLQFEHFHVDDAARRLVRFPQSMDVVLCMNLYGDILSDLGAETAGGLGLAPSGNFGDG
jgi:isocitrate/isopropylmalate dehydrogenase